MCWHLKTVVTLSSALDNGCGSQGIVGIFADHSSNEGTYIGLKYKDGIMVAGHNQLCNGGKGKNPWKVPGARTCL